MSTSNFYSVGLNHVGAYQVSGVPWISGSALPTTQDESMRFQFPSVTKKVIVRTTSAADVRLHFAPYDLNVAPTFDYTHDAATSANYITLNNTSPVELDVKCGEIFISPTVGASADSVEVYAELTNIPVGRMFSVDGLEGVSS